MYRQNMPIYRTSRSFRVCCPMNTGRNFPGDTMPSHELEADSEPDSFVRHNVDRPINVEQLVKCKMQDNLEFLQWTKRYWDQYYPGGDYDAVGRRKASGPPTGNLPSSAASRTMTSARARGTTPTTSGPRAGAPRSGMGMGMGMGMGIGMGGSGAGGSGAGGAGGSGSSSVALARDNDALKENVAGLEKERDFYFSKLRDIELLVQKEMDDRPELDADEGSMAKQIQTILYSTEEGFEIPQEGEAAGEVAPDEMETF